MTDDEATAGFWRRVERTDNCWLWLGRCDEYGSVYWCGTMTGAHRIAWTLTHGLIPSGQFVLHRCDHRGCVNPEHLFLGTHADNMADMKQKGRAIGRTWNRRTRTGGIAVKNIGSAQFRIIYPSLTEPTVVTVNGHPIGVWQPTAMDPMIAVSPTIRPETRSALPSAQAGRDDLLRKINRSK